MLYSYGVLQAKPLARKLVRTFNVAKQQLSQQLHYEFGLRAIKIVLSLAGILKLKAAGVIEADMKIKEGRPKKDKKGHKKIGFMGASPDGSRKRGDADSSAPNKGESPRSKPDGKKKNKKGMMTKKLSS
jgi:hypothetical protein